MPPTLRPSPGVAGLVICAAELLTGCPCGCVWVLSGVAELCLLSLLLLDAGLAVVEPLTVVYFYASSCGAGGLYAAYPAAGYPYGVMQTFLAPVACPAPAVELCLLGLRCLWYGAWFSTLCGAFLPGPAVLGSFPCRRLPAWGFCHRMPGLLLSRWLWLGCNPPLVFLVLLLRRMACWGSLGSSPCVRELP